MKKLSLKLATAVLLAAPALSFGAGHVIIRVKPPKTRIEVRSKAPNSNHVWVTGRWTWKSGKYVWVSGTWVKRPTPKALWVPGHWKKKHGGWIWMTGHWRE